jgi:hypothetical protein
MKTTSVLPLSFSMSCLLTLGLCPSQSAQMNMSLNLATPRILSITSAPAGQIPALNLQFQYDSKGRALCANGSTVDTNPVSGQATIVKKGNGTLSYAVSGKGTATKSSKEC